MAQEIAAGMDEDEGGDAGSLIGMVYGKKFVANTKIDRRYVGRLCVDRRKCSAGGGGGECVSDSPPDLVSTSISLTRIVPFKQMTAAITAPEGTRMTKATPLTVPQPHGQQV